MRWFKPTNDSDPRMQPTAKNEKYPSSTVGATRSIVKAASRAPPPNATRNARGRSLGFQTNEDRAPNGKEHALRIPKRKAISTGASTPALLESKETFHTIATF